MRLLPGGNRCSFPKLSKKQKGWCIYYRFYDDQPKPKYIELPAANHIANPKLREQVCKRAIEMELERLDKGYNPRTQTYITEFSVNPDTSFIVALDTVCEGLDCTPHAKEDVRSTVKYVCLAAKAMRCDSLPVSGVRRRHIVAMLKKLATLKPTLDVVVKNKKGEEKVLGKAKWSNNQYNSYRKNLSTLFEELIEMEATEVNPVLGIKKKKHAPKKKELLSEEQCAAIDEFAYRYDQRFHRLIHIFFHAGCRTTELFKVQGKHVDLKKQTVAYNVLKGRDYEWVDRPVKDIVLPFWTEAMKGCGPEDYVFAKGLEPGEKSIRPEQASRRWLRHIKSKLKISSDWYALKHLNTTATIDMIEKIKEGQRLATQQTGHKSEAMIVNIYDVKAGHRLSEGIKGLRNKFG